MPVSSFSCSDYSFPSSALRVVYGGTSATIPQVEYMMAVSASLPYYTGEQSQNQQEIYTKGRSLIG